MNLETEFELRVRRAEKSMDPAMPIVRSYAQRCHDCAEFGVRTGSSTIALLLGCTGKLYSYEIDKRPMWHDPIKQAAGDKWVLTYEKSELAQMPPVDLLLLDSYHWYDQVKLELDAHADKVKKYLLFHDSIGSAGPHSPKHLEGKVVQGIRLAVDELMIRDKTWFIEAHYPIRSGLLVLERRP